jgi:hypothetical protein
MKEFLLEHELHERPADEKECIIFVQYWIGVLCKIYSHVGI